MDDSVTMARARLAGRYEIGDDVCGMVDHYGTRRQAECAARAHWQRHLGPHGVSIDDPATVYVFDRLARRGAEHLWEIDCHGHIVHAKRRPP